MKNSEVHFGMVLKDLRKAQQLSQEGLADRSSLDRSYISSLERNLKKPGLDTIIALAAGLDMKVSEMFKEIEEHPENDWLWDRF
ncbi:helix-turn-helix domain-containing protein [Neobacillus sp. NPDC058068]|uniref:helix-turn-helix domain-containing protein n=1 Tax=Neobacillus sp. NPDC058068 TaxID=3346325 RepID=UPI0036DD271F